MNANFRNFAIWLVILFMLMGLFQVFQSSTHSVSVADKSYSQFVSDVDAGSVTAVTITDNTVNGTERDGSRFETILPQGADIINRLEARGVQITAREPEQSPFWAILLSSWLPFIVIIGVWFFFIRQMQGGGRGGAMGFGKSRAKLLTETHGKITFEDVAGVDEAKQDLEEIVEFLRDPGKFQRLGGKIPRGVLLVGPPGTGKTLLARSVAGEASVPFFTISGSDFVEMFVGVGASRVRDMFEQAKKNAPCIVFIDEITRSGVIAARASATAMTSASRRSTSCSSRWMASSRTTESFSSPPPTGLTCSIRRFCVRAVSIAVWWSGARMYAAAKRYCACTRRRCRLQTTWIFACWLVAHRASPAPTWRTW